MGRRTVGPEAIARVDRLGPDVAPRRRRSGAHELLKVVLVVVVAFVVVVVHAVGSGHLKACRVVVIVGF